MARDIDKGDYWQRDAKTFAGYYERQPLIRRVVSRFLDSRTRVLMSLLELQEQTMLLDLGCGSGVHLERFVGHCREVVGVDHSRPMLAIAANKLQSRSARGWRLLLADAEKALPFADRSFDHVIALGLLDYVCSPPSVLAECYRVLKDPGNLVFTIPKRSSLFSVLRTPPGNLVKRVIFGLPPIKQVLSRAEVNVLLRSTGFHMRYLTSIWTTMWMVKASKTEY